MVAGGPWGQWDQNTPRDAGPPGAGRGLKGLRGPPTGPAHRYSDLMSGQVKVQLKTRQKWQRGVAQAQTVGPSPLRLQPNVYLPLPWPFFALPWPGSILFGPPFLALLPLP